MRQLDGITDSTVMSLSELQETVKDRQALHAAVPGVTKSGHDRAPREQHVSTAEGARTAKK